MPAEPEVDRSRFRFFSAPLVPTSTSAAPVAAAPAAAPDAPLAPTATSAAPVAAAPSAAIAARLRARFLSCFNRFFTVAAFVFELGINVD
jgi:hypothetical protein